MRRHALGLALFFAVGATATAFSAKGQTTGAKADAAAPTTASTTAAAGAAPAATSTAAPATSTSAPAPAATAPTSTAAPAASGPAPAVPIPEKPVMDGATYGVRLRDLESRIDELKDQIRKSHTRLSLLSDTILSGGASGARAEVLFRNEMSSAFVLTRATFVVDGAVQYNRTDDTGALAEQKEIPIFSGSIPSGDHTVQAVLTFRGNGYGVFTYLRGYTFETKSAHSFTTVEGKTVSVVATALEKGGVTTPLNERPSIDWNEKVGAFGASASGGSAPASASGKAGDGSVSGSLSVGGGK